MYHTTTEKKCCCEANAERKIESEHILIGSPTTEELPCLEMFVHNIDLDSFELEFKHTVQCL